MKKHLTIILCAILAAVLFAGCDFGNDEKDEVSLSVVFRNGANFGTVSANCEKLDEMLYEAAESFGYVSIVRCDGKPEIVGGYKINKLGVDHVSEERLKSEADKNVRELKAGFRNAAAVEPEVDTLQAISLGAMSLSGRSGTKCLLVMDSGLSTANYLDFTKGLLGAEPADIVDALRSAHALPDLHGVHRVTWLFLGQTEEPQEPLSEAQRAALKEIWESVLYAAGAEEVEFRDNDRTIVSVDADAPFVSLVDVDARTIKVPVLRNAPTENELPVLETVILDENSIRFLGDQAVFADPSEAAEAIESVAKALLDNPENRVLIVGTTAGPDSSEFSKALSLARAESVRDVFVSFGIDSERMLCLGLTGMDDPWHLADTDSSGRLIEDTARLNRKVMIIDRGSEDALLLGGFICE